MLRGTVFLSLQSSKKPKHHKTQEMKINVINTETRVVIEQCSFLILDPRSRWGVHSGCTCCLVPAWLAKFICRDLPVSAAIWKSLVTFKPWDTYFSFPTLDSFNRVFLHSHVRSRLCRISHRLIESMALIDGLPKCRIFIKWLSTSSHWEVESIALG